MPDLVIRSAVATDIKSAQSLDHSGDSDYAWQLDFVRDAEQVDALFRRMRLPRSIRTIYPRPLEHFAENWNTSTLMLVGLVNSVVVAYLRLSDRVTPGGVWITDLVVDRSLRRQGVGSAMVLQAQQWATQRGFRSAMLECTTKNYPLIALAQKLGYEYCGYNDRYYPSRDIALFFSRELK